MRLHPSNAEYPEPSQPDEMPEAKPETPEEELPPEKRPLP